MAALSPVHRDGCARLGRMRLNVERLNVYEPITVGYVNGVPVTAGASGTGLRIEGASIEQILNDQTDTASFRMRGVVPVAGQTIAIYTGDTDVDSQLFGGRILETTQLYESRKQNRAHDIRCVDPTWLLNRRTVLTAYTAQSATAIVLDLVARFARGVSTRNVVLGLPVIDAITFTNEYLPVCLTAICERIGGHWYLGYDGDLHVFLSESPDANAITDAAPHGAADLALAEDLSQVVTKVIGRGGGARCAIDTPPGATELPVDEDQETWYATTGGLVETGTQVIQYAGVRGRGGLGALVGSSNAPAGLTLWRAANGALGVGTYQYGATFVTGGGESTIGPLTSISVTGAAYTAPVAPTRSQRTQGTSGMVPGGTYKFVWSFLYHGGGRTTSPALTQVVNGFWWDVYVGTPAGAGLSYYFPELAPSQGPLGFIEIYRTTNGGSTFYLDTQWSAAMFAAMGAGYWAISSNYSDAVLATGPTLLAAGGTFNAVSISDIPVSSASSVTQRKLYRTTANGTQPKLLTTLANNTATTYVDGAADGTLGANPPASDTSGLTDNRQVQPGVTELPVSSTAPFAADGGTSGGWVRVGTMPIHYTGIGAGVLTGLPATGNGALTAPVRYGTQILVQPRLVGIPASGTGAITVAIARGDTITIRLEQLDTAARDVMANRLQPPGGPVTADDGVIELVVSDSRFGLVELQDHLDATLLDRKDPQRTLTFTSRDPTLQVGRLITINTTEPPISGTFRIHKIAITEIAIAGGRASVHPLKRVEASSKIYKFTDLLRRLRSMEAGVR
jgi:hypothetical protein